MDTPEKKLLIVAIVVSVAILGIAVLSVMSDGEEKVRELSTSYKSCQVDSDCALFQPDCEDCTFEAVNEAGLSKLETEKRERCDANPPEFQCDAEFTGEIQCTDATCELVPSPRGE